MVEEQKRERYERALGPLLHPEFSKLSPEEKDILFAVHSINLHMNGMLGMTRVIAPKIDQEIPQIVAEAIRAWKIEQQVQLILWKEQSIGKRLWLRAKGVRPGQV